MRNSPYRKDIAKSMGLVALAVWNLPIKEGEWEQDECAVEAMEHLEEAYQSLSAILCDDAVLGEEG